ncbi:MAG: cyclic 2,3-diphosphoglycerate synthase [Candidatus Krumholzibacteria bacterium]|nr:cyclic 2,3-diphosphoglycerate synthase [Candidatus Krumholzibacteria bacterium]
MSRRKILIMGAAGRDFHNFNTLFRDDKSVEVVAFTATQIPDIADRKYPAALAGSLYPKGIPIYPEEKLASLIKSKKVEEVIFAYSDVSSQYVMQKAQMVNSLGAHFTMAGAAPTMVRSTKPVISVCAIRTGCGKSQTTRAVARILLDAGKKVAAIRHPMPYGDLAKQKVQRFASLGDLKKHKCTIEEMEEYEPHIVNGVVIYAGVDYEAILREAEKEADVILWDGGNNDMPFYRPDFSIVVVDPHRPGHELEYYPGFANLLMADAIVINKIDTADLEGIEMVRENIAAFNPKAIVIDAASPLSVDKPELIRGRKVLCVEDGPTLTHGGMLYGAGIMAAMKFGASELVDPRPWATGKLAGTFEKYPDIGTLLPAMGYGAQQIKDLERTIAKVKCDTVIIGTPIDLARVIEIKQPKVRVTYDLDEIGHPDLKDVLKPFLK